VLLLLVFHSSHYCPLEYHGLMSVYYLIMSLVACSSCLFDFFDLFKNQLFKSFLVGLLVSEPIPTQT
jgi:hypothetical protein